MLLNSCAFALVFPQASGPVALKSIQNDAAMQFQKNVTLCSVFERRQAIEPRIDAYLTSVFGLDFLLPNYITMLAISCLVGIYLCVKAAEKQGIPAQKSLNALLFAFIFAIVGARLYYCLQHVSFFVAHPAEVFALWKGGFASYGGFIGGVLAAVLYLKKARISVWKFADCCAPSIAIGVFLTRIGCFMNGCCFGKVSHFPWAVRFPQGSGPHIQQLINGQISGTENLSLPIHPTQIYHSITGFVLFLLLIYLRKYKRVDGQLFLIFAALYSLSRFLIEFYRGDTTRGFVSILSLPQLFSLVIVVLAGYFLIFKFWKKQVVSFSS